MVAGLVAGATLNILPQPTGGLSLLVVFYFFSVLLARALVGETVSTERQLYTQGLGTFLLLWFMVFALYTTFILYHG